MHWFLCVVLPCSADISALAYFFPARIPVSGRPKHPWLTAKAEIARSSEPEMSISNKSLLHASGGATPWIADILANLDPFLTLIRVFWQPKHPWLTARDVIAPPRGPELLNSNPGLLRCWCAAADITDPVWYGSDNLWVEDTWLCIQDCLLYAQLHM